MSKEMKVVGIVQDTGITLFDNPFIALRGIKGEGGVPLNVLCYFNPELSNNHGQNWAASLNNGGTPGVANAVAKSNIAPLILNVKHRPRIPGPNDPVTVTADVLDEMTSGISVMLFYRVDGSPSFYPLLIKSLGFFL